MIDNIDTEDLYNFLNSNGFKVFTSIIDNIKEENVLHIIKNVKDQNYEKAYNYQFLNDKLEKLIDTLVSKKIELNKKYFEKGV